jgi:hypothetical protein
MHCHWQIAERPVGPGQPITIIDPTGSANRRTVCVIPGNLTSGPLDGGLVRRTDTTDMAHARLIAMAPELRDALASLLDWESRTGGWEAPCWRKARDLMLILQEPPVTPARAGHPASHNPGEAQ